MNTARDTTAIPSASPAGITGASAATISASRTPAPDGTNTNSTPAAMARENPPMHLLTPLQPGAPSALASSHRCSPNNTQVAVSQAAADSTPVQLSGRGNGLLRARRRITFIRRVRTGGAETTSAIGSAASSSQTSPECASASTGAPTSPTHSPVDSDSPTKASDAVNARARGTPARRPSSICKTMAQTLPGRYLPSWPTRKIRPATTGESRWPSSASRARQAIRLVSVPASAATRDRATLGQASVASAARTSFHCDTTA